MRPSMSYPYGRPGRGRGEQARSRPSHGRAVGDL